MRSVDASFRLQRLNSGLYSLEHLCVIAELDYSIKITLYVVMSVMHVQRSHNACSYTHDVLLY